VTRRPPLPLPAGRPGEVAVVGLGASGRAAAELLRRHGHAVYASDAGAAPRAREAAQALTALGVDVQPDGHDLARIARAACVVASPGVPPEAPPLAAAREAGVPVVGELEVALLAMPTLRYVAVTGTNGKTTTTALVGHLLRALGHEAPDAGNIGTPLASLALRDAPPPWVALEMSSFQLHDTPSVKPTVGVVTNLSPDHLDRYPDVAAYYADKARLFANADAGSRWVLNADDAAVLGLFHRWPGFADAHATLPGSVHGFSVADPERHAAIGPAGPLRFADAHYDRTRGTLVVLGSPLLDRAALPLMGDHNVANALAAALAVAVADPAHRTPDARAVIARALASFRALAHRLEAVGTFDGVTWINDSKATNVASTQVALAGMSRPTILLLGGRHKGDPYTPLIPELNRCAKVVLAYGEAAPLVERDLAGFVPVERLGSSFDEVMQRARAVSAPGDVVLLSPACSSYDMFANYEERGATFRRLAAVGDQTLPA
jgi:UDP-N-acetylmuramoylalanine--D-glutamate ligase